MKKIQMTLLLLGMISFYLSAENLLQKKNPGPVARGKILYKKYCLTCHQQDGSGVQNMNPPLANSPYVLGEKSKLVKIVLYGLKDGVEINGDTYYNPMPAFGKILNDQQIADVLTYIRHSFENRALPVYRIQVSKLRAR